MRDDLLYYYERELSFLRRTGGEFARRYPKIAARLQLEANKCDDPHVERLLEGFAFLAARVHLKIDDDYTEISDALLNVLYPHYARPIPSMALVQLQLDPDLGKLPGGLPVSRGTTLYSRPVEGAPCKFRTCYDTTLWPIEVTDAQWTTPHGAAPASLTGRATAALRIELECLPDLGFEQLELDTLRLHINAEPNLASTLYELLCNNCIRVVVRDAGPGASREPVVLPADALQPVGFGPDEALLPYPRRAFDGHRLLQEYFVFPEKFFFLDLAGFERVRAAGFGSKVEVVFLIAPFERDERQPLLETGVGRGTIRLGCTPIVNLFAQTSEPVLLDQRRPEYLVVADARRRETTAIYSIDDVVAVSPGSTEPLRFDPLYSFRHGTDTGGNRLFWHASRRPTRWRADEATDVFLSFVDDASRVAHPDVDAVTARLTCFNGDLPRRLPFGGPDGDFELPGGGPVRRIVTLTNPTAVVQPPLGKPVLWRLISQLSLNYVSLLEGGAEALRELLRLHNAGDSSAGNTQIDGIVGVRGEPCYSRIESEHGLTFARGQRLELEFDEERFAGGGVYLLASVLERFLGMLVSLNSFSILSVRTRQRKEILREWAPRAGRKALV